MIWSVSMLLLGSGTRRLSNFMVPLLEHRSDVSHHAHHRGRGGGERAHQERAAAFTLASFEIAIAGGDAVLAGLQLIAVHGDAHRAAGLAPVATGVFENLRQTFGFRLRFDGLR